MPFSEVVHHLLRIYMLFFFFFCPRHFSLGFCHLQNKGLWLIFTIGKYFEHYLVQFLNLLHKISENYQTIHVKNIQWEAARVLFQASHQTNEQLIDKKTKFQKIIKLLTPCIVKIYLITFSLLDLKISEW